MKALITFGCSWTAGKFCWYEPDIHDDEMSYTKLKNIHNDNDEYSFRKILSRRYNYENVNYADGGSSNTKQFRLAEEYFNKDYYKKYKDVIVLWGITSTARFELWNVEKNRYQNYSLGFVSPSFTKDRKELINILREKHYDHDVEVKRLSTQIKHWDNYFSMIGVKNYWFDTFNHHNYDYNSPNMIMIDESPRDLMSLLCKNYGCKIEKDQYHFSQWISDGDRIKFLEKNKLVNTFSHHPTKQAHTILADILDKFVNFCYYK